MNSVQVSVLEKLWNPLNGCWPDLETPLTEEEINEVLLNEKDLTLKKPFHDDVSRQDHLEKIAYFVKYGFNEPIQIDVGIPSMGCYVGWPVIDGNHRLAAAVYTLKTSGKDVSVPIEVAGDLAVAKKLKLIRKY